ncbi:dCTP pyrophosphatase 1-like isoform X1 [Pocillopora damicornis]|uniref:dCTP pyrophosphatase 1-like isoform X1 n=1 Tax=Pocillopora damicornis TaxID=46731 RepID=UPI000F558274|nr:dCTP pyrophosphatase 1-like isoform X1 [Pocillopora damicornis]
MPSLSTNDNLLPFDFFSHECRLIRIYLLFQVSILVSLFTFSRQMQSQFAKERDWDQFHQPRNLVLAMVGEVGEVAELFQWKGEVKEGLPDWSLKDKHHLAQELSDVLIYLVRLAEKCHVDLPKEVVAKIALNSKKYPADLVKGSSKKYTEYKEMNSSNN